MWTLQSLDPVKLAVINGIFRYFVALTVIRTSLYFRTCEDEEVIELIPVHTNYDLLCGTKLEIKILPKSANPKGPHKIKVVAENLDVTEGPQTVEYNIVVSPIKRIEIMADKTQLKVSLILP